MNFRVGPYLYRLKLVDGYLYHEGEKCLGLCDNDRQLIWVSAQASETQQIQAACHEYMEAWIYHFGQGLHDKEDYCDLFGMAMTQFVLDVLHQLRIWSDAHGPSDAPCPTTAQRSGSTPGPLTGRRVAPAPASAAARQDRFTDAHRDTTWRIRIYEPPISDCAPADPVASAAP